MGVSDDGSRSENQQNDAKETLQTDSSANYFIENRLGRNHRLQEENERPSFANSFLNETNQQLRDKISSESDREELGLSSDQQAQNLFDIMSAARGDDEIK